MTDEEQRIIKLIKDSFAGVTLGEGIGLWEGNALDDYADETTLEQYRRKDEREDWSAISVDDLNFCHWSLTFLDAEGMRFLLPAFLVSDVIGQHGYVMFHLVELPVDMQYRYELLTSAQRMAVREFLSLRRSDPMYELEHYQIDRALEGYWNENRDR